MRSLQDEIRKIQQSLFCPVCRRPFDLQDIQLHAFSGKGKAELSIVCSRGHFPAILLVPINLSDISTLGPIEESELVQAQKRIESVKHSIEEIWR